MKTQEQIDARDRKELAQRKKQKNKKALKYGLLLTLLALFLASVTDEISSAIGVQVQSSVVTEFFVRPLNVPYNEAMAMFSTATTFSYALMALVPFYKALADKFGRKPFLVLNTLGMGVGMALAWWSPNMVLYFIGYGMTVFFVQHDMQIVYLYEIVPKERRATIYGLIKGISTLGVVPHAEKFRHGHRHNVVERCVFPACSDRHRCFCLLSGGYPGVQNLPGSADLLSGVPL